MKLRLIDEARLELLEAISYYKSIDSALGQRFDIEVDSGIRRISNHPQHFHLRAVGYRRINLRDFPDFISFITRKDTLWVLAFAHASRRPHYWISRKKGIQE